MESKNMIVFLVFMVILISCGRLQEIREPMSKTERACSLTCMTLEATGCINEPLIQALTNGVDGVTCQEKCLGIVENVDVQKLVTSVDMKALLANSKKPECVETLKTIGKQIMEVKNGRAPN